VTEAGTGARSPFRHHAAKQAVFCEALGAPFTAGLCRLLGERIAAASPLGQTLDSWPTDPATDALVLRLTGGLHAAARSGTAPALQALYPPAPTPAPDALWAAVQPILEAPAFAPWLQSAPQTNEVGRSGALAPAMLVAAAQTGLPLALFELGASAGLNLFPDHFALRLGGVSAGDPLSALVIQPQWQGADPPAVPLLIASREGVDLNPLSVASAADVTRMLAYVWPDQPERLERMQRAIAIAALNPPLLVSGDAAAYVEQRIRPRRGVTTLLFHSIAFQYFPPETQGRITAHVQAAAQAATTDAPLGWLRYEMTDPAHPASPELRLRLWPDGEDRLLAVGHPHGHSVHWLA